METWTKFWNSLKLKASEYSVNNSNESQKETESKQPQPVLNKRSKEDGLVYGDLMEEEACGYDLYPERIPGKPEPSYWAKVWGYWGRGEVDRVHCEQRLYKVFNEGPLVKILTGALNSAGCKVDLRRHFSCEVCKPKVNGGYDRRAQQIVICQNNVGSEDLMQSVMTHELIHMYDHCVNKVDFTNLEHLACTEIRAYNLTTCNLSTALWLGDISILDIFFTTFGGKHKVCVRNRAVGSLMAARTITREKAEEIVDRVFPICYNDLEPIGRRLRSGSYDNIRAYRDAEMYGYV